MPEFESENNLQRKVSNRDDLFLQNGIDLSAFSAPLQLTRSETLQFGEQLLESTDSWREIVTDLVGVTDDRLKQRLSVIGFQGDKSLQLSNRGSDYESANFTVSNKPTQSDLQTLHHIRCGYLLKEGLRRVLDLSFIALDSSGKIVEVGAKSDEALSIFKDHIFGRQVDSQYKSVITEINQAFFETLREDPKSDKRLQEFMHARGWPKGLGEKAGIAYFHEKFTPVLAWAISHGFSPQEMFNAGWCERTIASDGSVRYGANGSNVIRIPYYNDAGELTVWRTRNLRIEAQDKHKYLSWPLDRSVSREFEVGERLYYGWRINEVEGRDIVVTEGEFKCLVAWELSGVPTFGIPGITEVSPKILKALIAANPASITVILDRDPIGKGMRRVDGITDSARASYRIAKDLEEMGYQNSRVGVIPNIFNGGKVGLDDMILATDPSTLHDILKRGMSPNEYAENISLDPRFAELLRRRQVVRKSLEQYLVSVERGGTKLAPERVESAVELLKTLSLGYRQYLKESFRGARRVDQVDRSQGAYHRIPIIPNEQHKIMIDTQGRMVPLERFRDDIATLQFVTSDVNSKKLFSLSAENRLPLTMSVLLDYFHGTNRDSQVTSYLRRGIDAILPQENPLHYQPATLSQLATLVLAGYLQSVFPADEYKYEAGLCLFGSVRDYWEQIVEIPLTIFRKGGDAVAIASVPVFERAADQHIALHHDQRLWSRLGFSIRQSEAWHSSRKYEAIGDLILDHYASQQLDYTERVLSPLGFNREFCIQENLVVFSNETWGDFKDYLSHKRLLTQAAESGFFSYSPNGEIIPRFHGDVVLLPIFNQERKLQVIRVLPLAMIDQVPPVSPPDCKPIFPLYGPGRNWHTRYQSDRHLYRDQQIDKCKESTLIITYNEWDALHLGQHKDSVVGLNSSLHLHENILRRIASAAPKEIIFLLPPEARSRYDNFNFDGIPGIVKELHDLQLTLKEVVVDKLSAESGNGSLAPITLPEIRLTIPALPASQVARFMSTQLPEYIDQLLEQALPLSDFLQNRHFNPQNHEVVQRFSKHWTRFLQYLEIPALGDPLDRKPVDFWLRQIVRLHKSIDRFASAKYSQPIPSLDEMLQEALSSKERLSFREVVSRRRAEEPEYFRSRPLYYPGNLRYTSPNFSRLKETIAIRAHMLGPDSTENFKRLNLLDPKSSIDSQKNPTIPMASPTTQQNAVGALYELMQKFPTRFSPPLVVFSVQGSLHECALQISLDGAPYASKGVGAKKQDAKSQAFAAMVTQLTELDSLSVQPSSLPNKAMKSEVYAPDVEQVSREAEVIAQNFPGKLQEFCAQRKLALPRYDFRQSERGGVAIHSCICTVSLPGVTFSSEFQSSSVKQSAKHLAAEVAWRRLQIEAPEASLPLPSSATQEARALMPADGNFVGALQTFCARSKIALPHYEEESRGGTQAFRARVQLFWNDKAMGSEWVEAKSKPAAKREAAKLMCNQLFAEMTSQAAFDSAQHSVISPDTASAVDFNAATQLNYVGAIQEYTQKMGMPSPQYTDGPMNGPDHAKTFTVLCLFVDKAGQKIEICSDSSSSKKTAKLNVAQKLYQILKDKGVEL